LQEAAVPEAVPEPVLAASIAVTEIDTHSTTSDETPFRPAQVDIYICNFKNFEATRRPFDPQQAVWDCSTLATMRWCRWHHVRNSFSEYSWDVFDHVVCKAVAAMADGILLDHFALYFRVDIPALHLTTLPGKVCYGESAFGGQYHDLKTIFIVSWCIACKFNECETPRLLEEMTSR
jgi:hypothetical protein